MQSHSFYYPVSLDEFINDLKDPASLINQCEPGKYYREAEIAVFDGNDAIPFIKLTWPYVIAAVFFYLFFTYILAPALLPDRKIKPKWLLIIWNIALGQFSLVGCYFVGRELLLSPETGLLTAGVFPAICGDSHRYGHGVVGYFVYLFVVSKTVELGDTVWLLLGKRPIITLHTWHHFSVTIWSWHSYMSATSLGLCFAFMNYSVHAAMYNYYAMTQISEFTKSLVRPIAIFITQFQILQMFLGCAVNLIAFYYVVFTDLTCCLNPTNNVLGSICYGTYLFLFVSLYLGGYRGKKNSKSKRS